MPVQQFQTITDAAVRGMFFRRLEAGADSWVNRVAMRVPSSSKAEEYGFLGMVPQLQEWVGGREAKFLREYSFEIRNKDFEGTVAIKEKDLTRDKTGQVQRRIDDLADRAMRLPAKLLSKLIEAGETAICYDGQYFFDTGHAEGDSGSQSNDLSVTVTAPTAPTVAEFRTAVMGAVEAAYGFKDDRGEPVNEEARQWDVMVPWPFMGVAMSALTLPVINDGTGAVSNVLTSMDGFAFRPVVNPRLTWTDRFAVLRSDAAGATPFILQEEEPVELEVLGPGSDHHFKHKERLFSAVWSGNVGFGDWRGAVLVTFTT